MYKHKKLIKILYYYNLCRNSFFQFVLIKTLYYVSLKIQNAKEHDTISIII